MIENLTAYKSYLHGEAVAIGMNMANILACKLGFLNHEQCEQIQRLLQSYDLPTRFEVSNPQAFYEQFYLDKKVLILVLLLFYPMA